MAAVLTWSRSIVFSVLNSIAKLVVFVLLLLLVALGIVLARGDGMPGNMVLSLDLREGMSDTANGENGLLIARDMTLLDLTLALENARKDARVKGIVLSCSMA